MVLSVLLGASRLLVENSYATPQGGAPIALLILAGTGDSAYRPTDAAMIRNVKSLQKFEVAQDGSLVCRLSESTSILVRKSEPGFKRLRFKRHILSLYDRFGSSTPFPFSKLQEGEFGGYLNEYLQQSPTIVPDSKTQLCFIAGLTSSLSIPGFPVETTLSPSVKRGATTEQILARYPANRLVKREDIIKRMQSLQPVSTAVEMTTFPNSKALGNTESELMGFRMVRAYLKDADLALDQELESKLSGSIYDKCKAMRKLKTVEQVQSKDAAFYARLKMFFESDIENTSSEERRQKLEEFSRATISYTYSFSVNGSDGKNAFSLQIL